MAYANIPLRSLNIALPLLLSQKNQSQKHFTRLRAECDNWVDTLYDELKKSRVDKDMSRLSLAVRTEKDESLMESIYIGLALFYVTRNKSVRAIDVLETMVQDGHTPTFQLCEKLLDAALDSSNIKVAILLISWFGSTLAPTAEALKTGQAKRLSYEKIRRVLLLAFKDKVPSLVDPTYQLFTAHGYAVSPLDFALCARIHINARGVIDALEYFFAAEEAGVDLLRLSPEEVMEANTYVPDDELEGGDEGLSGLDDEVRGLDKVSSKKCTSTKKLEESSRSSSLGRRLQIEICDAFEFKLKELDELYFALLDLVRMGRRIPMVVLNGLIMSVGRHGQMDRAFATFEELPTVFGREPDVFTFNSLLYAICVSINPRISYMVPIFEEMESRGVQPDAFSFSYLMLTMADTAELDGFCDLLTFMESKGTLPSPNSLRRVAITLARHGHWESCKKCLAALATYEDQTPRFFLRRIQYFRKKHGLPVDPTLPSFIGIIPSIASK